MNNISRIINKSSQILLTHNLLRTKRIIRCLGMDFLSYILRASYRHENSFARKSGAHYVHEVFYTINLTVIPYLEPVRRC
jgi:hypothetical protein